MTEETVENVENNNNINISIEQICAAILNTVGAVEVSLEKLVTDYTSKSIAVNQDSETKSVTFTLVDAPAPVKVEEETAE
jgi:hypothetical protein